MAFLDKLSDFAKNAKSGAEDLVETTKLNSRIYDEQKKITRLKAQLGDFIWEQYAAGDSDLPQGALEICSQIDQSNEEIAGLNMQINLIRSQANAEKSSPVPPPAVEDPSPFGNCFSCGAALDEGDRFCSLCGAAQPLPQEEETVVDVEPEQAPRLCPVCSREVADTAVFCSVCGAKIETA
ncbi:MAG: zinc ribbon domain-containing protein [Bacillota bacterium]|nr:zinc ribbon domain-containing protein [Bacillota bacterium]